MPNVYGLKMTNGALKLERHHDRGSDGLLLPPAGGGGTLKGRPGQSTQGRRSLTWSARSRRQMRFEFGALPWEMLGRRPVMITLTYPGEWAVWVEDARELHKHREAFKERWRRKWGTPVGVWVTEFQKRGAPHLHLYVGLPGLVGEQEYVGLQKRTMERKRLERRVGSYEARRRLRAPSGEFAMWLRTAWWEVVGSELRAHHGRGVDIACAFFSEHAESEANRTRVADYFWRESGKWAQKNPPDGFGGLKFYGRWGQKDGFKPVVTEAEMDERTGLELRRVMRRWQQQKLREAAQRSGRRYRSGAGGSRGRDGLTVFDIDGRTFGPGLLEWAHRLADQKAAESGGSDRVVVISGAGRKWLRAWSEFEVDIDGPPEPLVETGPEDADVEAWMEPDDPVEQILEHDAAEDAAAEAWMEARQRRAARERRKAELRAKEKRRHR